MSKEFTYKETLENKVGGEAILSGGAVCFYTVEFEAGKVIGGNHHPRDKNTAGKILIMPFGKGSFVVQADDLYKLRLHGKVPKATIIRHADIVLVSSVTIMKTLMVYKVEEGFYQETKDRTKICVGADNGKITIF